MRAGLVLAPGFIDPHTHYDAQVAWDPLLTCSSWHGITTVVMGNCGVGVAPCRPEAREILMGDLVNVEAIRWTSCGGASAGSGSPSASTWTRSRGGPSGSTWRRWSR
jgi:hypothetical protein